MSWQCWRRAAAPGVQNAATSLLSAKDAAAAGALHEGLAAGGEPVDLAAWRAQKHDCLTSPSCREKSDKDSTSATTRRAAQHPTTGRAPA